MSDEFEARLLSFIKDWKNRIDGEEMTPREIHSYMMSSAEFSETIGDRFYDLGNSAAAVMSWNMAHSHRAVAEAILTREPINV